MPDSGRSELIADIKEHVRFLKELGVDLVASEFAFADAALDVSESPSRDEVREVPVRPLVARESTPPEGRIKPGERISALPSLSKRRSVRSTGEQSVNIASTSTASIKPAVSEPSTAERSHQEELVTSGMYPASLETIEQIRAEIGDCTRCPLHAQGRKQIVHTTGNFDADLMFIGEAPGADEDEQGFPFVGRAGQLLTKIIESIGLKRDEVCIGNINRCRPPGNRKPEPVETAACRPFILREIQVVRPKVVVVLGATAAHNLLQVKTPITKLRGQFHDYFGVKVMPTFHPAYLLRDPHKKRDVWEDMKKVRDFLAI